MKKLSIGLYTIDKNYTDFLLKSASHLYVEKDDKEAKSRKFVGILLKIDNFKYFAPLTSYKSKHSRLSNSTDFIKILHVAALNLNLMFPAPDGTFYNVIFSNESDKAYRDLLFIEYRFIKANEELIKSNAQAVYDKAISCPESKLAKRCNDFKKLEEQCLLYEQNYINIK